MAWRSIGARARRGRRTVPVVVMAMIVSIMMVVVETVVVVVVHHMFEVPARLFVVAMRLIVAALNDLLIVVNEPSVARVGTMLLGAAVPLMVARRPKPVMAVAFAGRMHQAVVFAIPAQQMAVVIAAPFARAAIAFAAPPSDAAIVVAGTMAIAVLVAVPAVPAAVMAAAPSLAAAIVVAMAMATPAAAMLEFDLRHGVERIEQDGVHHMHAGILVDAAGFARAGQIGRSHAESEKQRSEKQPQGFPSSAVRPAASCHHGTLHQ